MGFLLPKSPSNVKPTRLYGFRLSTSLAGIFQPIQYGTNRIAPNVIFAGPFTSHQVKTGSGKGGGSGKGSGGGKDGNNDDLYYTGDIVMALAAGPCLTVLSVWQDKTLLKLNQITESVTVPSTGPYTWTPTYGPSFTGDTGATRTDPYSQAHNDYGNPGGAGTMTGNTNTPMTPTTGSPGAGQYVPGTATSPTYTFSPSDAGKSVAVTYSFYELTDGTNGSPTTQLALSFFNGAIGQAAWSYLTTQYASMAYGYSGMALMAAQQLNLGTDGNLPNFNFELQGQYCFGGAFPLDCNPADVIEDLLTSPYYGVPGWTTSLLGDASEFSNYCVANGVFISPAIDQQQQASDWIQEFLTIGNGAAVWSDNLLKFRSYGDTTAVGNGATFIPNTAPVFDLDDDDYLVGKKNEDSHSDQDESFEPLQVERPDVQDAANYFTVTWSNRGNGYNPEPVPDYDFDAVRKYGRRDGDTLDYPCITLHSVAQQVVNLAVKNSVYKRAQFKCSVGPQYCLLEPMDMVTVTSEERGIFDYPLRITSVTENDDYSIDWELETFPWGTQSPTVNPKQTINPNLPGYFSVPGSVNVPDFFEATSEMTQSKNFVLLIALSGSYLWGGCTVHVSRDGGTTYAVDGVQKGASSMGQLTADLAAGSDPDLTNAIHVTLSESDGSLLAFTQSQADNFQSLICVDQELIGYTTATLTSSNNYTLSGYLRRGVYGTPITPHTAGAPVFALDGNPYELQYQKGDIGNTLFLKFTSFNQFQQAEESLANVVPYSRTLDGGEARPPYSWQPGQNFYATTGPGNLDALGSLSTFSLTQTYQQNADGSATPQISIAGYLPPNTFSQLTMAPTLTAVVVQPAGGTFGIVGTGQSYLVAINSQDSVNGQSPLSNLQSVTLPGDGALYQIQCAFTADTGAAHILAYIGSESDALMYAGSNSITSPFIINVYPYGYATTIGAPDAQADSLVIRARYQEAGGIVGTAVNSKTPGSGSSQIGIANLSGFTSNQLAGRVMTIYGSVQNGGVSKTFRRNMAITGNTSSSLTVADSLAGGFGGPPAVNVGDAVVIRAQANIASEFTIGDSLFVNPYIPAGLGNVAGYFVRIISGPGMGQERTILSNTTTTLTLLTGWDVLPTAASSFVILSSWQPEFISPSLSTGGLISVTTTPISLSIPNFPSTWFVDARFQDVNGARSSEADAPFLEFFLWGNAGTASTPNYALASVAADVFTMDLSIAKNQELVVPDAGPISIANPVNVAGLPNFSMYIVWPQAAVTAGAAIAITLGTWFKGFDSTGWDQSPGMCTVIPCAFKDSTSIIPAGSPVSFQPIPS